MGAVLPSLPDTQPRFRLGQAKKKKLHKQWRKLLRKNCERCTHRRVVGLVVLDVGSHPAQQAVKCPGRHPKIVKMALVVSPSRRLASAGLVKKNLRPLALVYLMATAPCNAASVFVFYLVYK